MGAAGNKLFLPLRDRPILAWTLAAAAKAANIQWIGILAQPHDKPEIASILADLDLAFPVEIIPGGDTRQASVYNGLQALPPDAERVLVHDGARCLATPALFERFTPVLAQHPAAIAAIPVKDTLKLADETRRVQRTIDRSQLWAAQTPQGFAVADLKRCHQLGRERGWQVTDDAALCERCALPVQIVPGEDTNLKVTTPADLAIAEFILSQRGTS